MPSYTGILLSSSAFLGVRGFRSAPQGDTCRVFIQMADPSGEPVVGRVITFHNRWDNPVHRGVQGKLFVGGHQVSMETDSRGYAEIRLLRGARFEAVITGTSYVRVITIPDKVAANLLDLVSDVLDQFDVVNLTPIDAPRFS